jgi:hypothetical protein
MHPSMTVYQRYLLLSNQDSSIDNKSDLSDEIKEPIKINPYLKAAYVQIDFRKIDKNNPAIIEKFKEICK